MKFRKITALLLALLMSFSLLTGCASVSQEVKDEVVNSIVDAVVSELENAANAETKDSTVADTGNEQDKDEPSQTVPTAEPAAEETPSAELEALLDEDGEYTTKEDVALYIYLYGHLPENFITKKEAQDMGWNGGSLDPYYYGGSIGGDYFGNYEGQLPKAPGRKWTECDINTMYKKSRGAERIVFSNDGLIYYTGDHYETFEQLY